VAPLYLQKLALTSPTCGGRSVGIVRSRTQTMEFFKYIPPKRRLNSNRLHGATSQKIEPFITFAVGTSNRVNGVFQVRAGAGQFEIFSIFLAKYEFPSLYSM
jgi:hypothetical protein